MRCHWAACRRAHAARPGRTKHRYSVNFLVADMPARCRGLARRSAACTRLTPTTMHRRKITPAATPRRPFCATTHSNVAPTAPALLPGTVTPQRIPTPSGLDTVATRLARDLDRPGRLVAGNKSEPADKFASNTAHGRSRTAHGRSRTARRLQPAPARRPHQRPGTRELADDKSARRMQHQSPRHRADRHATKLLTDESIEKPPGRTIASRCTSHRGGWPPANRSPTSSGGRR